MVGERLGKIHRLADDLCFDRQRMSQSGQETYDELMKELNDLLE